MKNKLFILLISLLIAFSFSLLIAEGSGSQSHDKSEKDHKSIWIEMTDAEKKKEAFEQAKKENKYVLALFTGSDWCPPCMMLESDVLSKKEFTDNVLETFIAIKFDLPRKRKVSEQQQKFTQEQLKKYDLKSVPSVLIFDAQGKQIGKTGFQTMSPQEYLAHLKSFIKKYEDQESNSDDNAEYDAEGNKINS